MNINPPVPPPLAVGFGFLNTLVVPGDSEKKSDFVLPFSVWRRFATPDTSASYNQPQGFFVSHNLFVITQAANFTLMEMALGCKA